MIKLKTHGDLHIPRKLFHFFGVMAMFVSLITFSKNTNAWIFLLTAIPILSLDFGRQYSKSANKLTLKFLGPLLRRTEAFKPSSTAHLLIGVGIIFFIFPVKIVALSLLLLAIGDPIASFFGILFGKTKILGKKSLEGSFAAFFFCSCAAYLYYFSQNIFMDHILLASLATGLIAAISELIPLFGMDDNFSQPIISASLLSLLFFTLGGF